MIDELARDYAKYIKVDVNAELHGFQETVDDMLTRLEEFENLVNMVKTDGDLCADVSIPQIMQLKENLDSLCNRIDRLDQFVNRVKSDLELVEAQVVRAESEIGQGGSTFKNTFKPLFVFSSNEAPSRRIGRTENYEAPTLFSTSDYFLPSEVERQDESKVTSPQ